MTSELRDRCCRLVVELGLGRADEVACVEPLAGGVASDIASVRVGERRYCLKFALPRLKVAEEWLAPVHRNAAEYAWLQAAARIVPQSAIGLFGRSEPMHGFAMEFVSGEGVYLWKAALLDGAADRGEARRVGDMVGRIHAASARPGFETGPFRNRDDFRAIRIEPYLTFTAGRHAALAGPLHDLADMLYRSDRVLVHGDVSPKNILMRASGPVILDAECATMGDASFDPAFCLNHLVLKAVHLPGTRERLLASVGAFHEAYAAHVDWEPLAGLEARICRLLPALMLARVDGKSPVEYLDEPGRTRVRGIATGLIRSPVATLADFAGQIAARLREQDA